MKSLSNLNLTSKRVLCRFDLNVPLNKLDENTYKRHITDFSRINAIIPTIEHILDQKPKQLTIMSHLARPKGIYNKHFSMKPVADHLQTVLNEKIELVDISPENVNKSRVMCLENLRFYKGEEDNCEEFSKLLSNFGDVYVNDAFGTTHRKHASVHGITNMYKQEDLYPGFLLQKELNALDKLLNNAEKPFVAVLGGFKVSDKIDTIRNLLNVADKILIGGAMAYCFLKCEGINVGESPCDENDVIIANELKEMDVQGKIIPRMDHVIHPCLKNSIFESKNCLITKAGHIPPGYEGLDIGPQTIDLFDYHIKNAKTLFWNGPMGLFENELFSHGTYSVAKSISNSNGYTVVGGGDSVAAINLLKLDEKSYSHICTGGGASLEYLSSGQLPGIDVLKTEC